VPDEPFSVWDVKALIEDAARRAYRGGARVVPTTGAEAPWEAQAFVVLDAAGMEVGRGGRLREGVVDAPVWADAVWALEMTLPAEVPVDTVRVFERLPQHPAVERDLALLVPDAVSAEAVTDAIRGRAGALLERVALFDHYRGEGVPAGKRSVAFSLRFRAPERTLKDKEVDRAVESIVGGLKEELGVELRG
jgi:phenylalanyl-tRNA synthetase beta chain